jgi:arginyl-tRNA synthetase
VYRSAIALKLASLWQLNSLDIANQLVASLPTSSQDTASQSGLDFGVEVVPPGWINFRLSDPGLATWLQHMIQIPASKGEGELGRGGAEEEDMGTRGRGDAGNRSGILFVSSSSLSFPKDAPNLFPLQYAHARCCSILRLAHWQSLIKLQDLDFKTLSWQLVEPKPIPWLEDDQGTHIGQGVLRLVHPTERRLIAQLLDLQAAISDSEHLSLIKLGNSLSKAFEQFYSSCRIFGEVKTQNPTLAQARLGLVAITQAMLRSLLEDQLGVSAPVEL